MHNETVSPFTKVVRIGTVNVGYGHPADLFCEVKFGDGRLSITGVEGPTRGGNCRGACGQVVMHEWEVVDYAPCWDAGKVAKFRAVWEQWHLNDMQAGSPAQEAYLKAHPITDRLDHYRASCVALDAVGLNPDPGYLHNGKPYRYGYAWLSVELPAEVLSFLQSLPEADKAPAWV